MTIIPFQPNQSLQPPFSASVVLDGDAYNLIAMWNFYSQRYYYQLIDQAGNVLINAPLIGSPLDYDIFLAPGLFTESTLLYREDNQNFEVTP